MNNDFRNEKIAVSFGKYPFCFNTVNIKSFINKLHDDNEFHKMFKTLITQILPHLQQEKLLYYISNREKHTHIINDDQHLNVIKQVLKKMYIDYYGDETSFESFYENNINSEAIWQLGCIGGIRLICLQHKNIFHVLFIDYYHIIYEDVKHNYKDISNNNYCPINNYGGEI